MPLKLTELALDSLFEGSYRRKADRLKRASDTNVKLYVGVYLRGIGEKISSHRKLLAARQMLKGLDTVEHGEKQIYSLSQCAVGYCRVGGVLGGYHYMKP